jgi:hypothetical protein
MEIQIELELLSVREGWLARTPSLRLAAVGESETAATERLFDVVATHCRVLAREGWLERAMARERIALKETVEERLVVVRQGGANGPDEL